MVTINLQMLKVLELEVGQENKKAHLNARVSIQDHKAQYKK